MASFKEQYDELFGASPPYDPIKLRDRTENRADDMLAAAPSAAPVVDQELRLPDIPTGEARGDDSGFGENIARLFGAGTVQVGEMGLGAAEYVARQNTFLDGIVADTLYSGRGGLAEVREGILAGISEEDMRQVEGELLTLDPNRTIWTSPGDAAEAIIYKTVQALPATLVTMVPAIRWARAASPGTAVAYMGASEGVMSTGGIANAITDEIMSMDTETLLQESPRFAQLLEESGGNADEARDQLIVEAQGVSPLAGGATVAAISSVAGRYFTPIFEKGGGASLGQRAARGFAAEAPQEGSQGAAEQLVQNYAARIYDLDRQLSEGVAEAAAQEALIGGGMGAGAGAMFGQRPTPEAPPIDPDARPDLTDQMDFGGPLAPGGTDPNLMPDEADQPTPEPDMDIRAQVDDLLNEGSTRNGVYISPGTDERYVATLSETLPDNLTFVRNVDGRGGHLITKSAELGLRAQEEIANGASHQEVIGRILGVGRGKPTNPDSRVVQLLAADGSVARESMQANQQQAEALGVEWSKEEGNKDLRVAILTPQQAVERREQLGAVGGDIPVQEDMFDNQAARGTAIEPVPAPEPAPGQQELPLVQRQRGVRPQPLPEQGPPAPLNLDAIEESILDKQDPYEVSRRQDDLFEGEAIYEQPVQDEVRDDIRSTVPFEERDEAFAAVDDTRSVQQASERLVGEAASTFQQEEQERIGGFYNPNRLEFADKTYEESYQDAWSQLVDAELTIEMSNQKQAVERAKKRRQRLFQELGEIRQIAKPKTVPGRAEGLIRAAERVSPATRAELREKARGTYEPEPGPQAPGTATPQRATEQDYLGEFRGGTREQIDDLATYTVRHKTPKAKEWNEESFENGADAYARRDEIKKRYPKRQVQVRVEGTRQLDAEFERAVTFREGREAESRQEGDVVKTEPKTDDGPKSLSGKLEFAAEETAEETGQQEVEFSAQINRDKYKTPGAKLKFIRREAEHKRRLDTGQKSVKTATVRRTSAETKLKRKTGESEQRYQQRVAKAEEKKKLSSAPLTQESFKLDESVADRKQRETTAKESLREVGKSATKAKTELTRMKKASKKPLFFDTMSDKFKSDFLYARNYLEQLIQFARSIQASKTASNDTIKLAEGIKKMLDAVEDIDYEVFAEKWGAIARKNEFDDLSSLKFSDLAGMRDPAKRAKDTAEQQRTVSARAKLRALNEQLRSDSLYQQLIAPVLNKMSWSIVDNVEGNYTEAYIPNQEEVEQIKYAMQTWKNQWKPTREERIFRDVEYNPLINRKEIYTELRQILRRAGFNFDENGNVSGFTATDNYLEVAAKSKSGVIKPPPPTADAINREMDRTKKRQEQRDIEDRGDLTRAAKLYDRVNGLIEAYRAKTSTAKTTISGIKRQEQRFIRGLKKLGVWRDTGTNRGQINIEGYSTKSYMMVGPRLDAKTLRKDAAKNVIQRVAPFPIPRTVKPYLTQARSQEEYRAGVEKFLDENAIELFNEAARPVEYDTEYTAAAEQIGDQLAAGNITGNDVVNTILEIAPQDSFYRNLADRLSRRDVADVEVRFGTEKGFPMGQYGKFNRTNNRVLVNRDALNMDNLRGDSVFGARVMHTLTHELVHAQTHISIDNNPTLRANMEQLQSRARERWQNRVGTALPYGLKDGPNAVHEFVAEAFSNHEFQQFLKETPRKAETLGELWSQFVEAVRNIFGLPPRAPTNSLFDSILLTEDVLFDDAGFGGVAQGDLYLTGDIALDKHVEDAQNMMQNAFDWLRNKGRNLMTFEQLYDANRKWFDDAPGENPFTRYMDAWKSRSAKISKHMKEAERLSTAWTKLEATDNEQAQKVSRLGTFATIHKVTAAKVLNAKEQAELEPERLEQYLEARQQFEALTPEGKQLYRDVSEWYKGVARNEADLLMNASLRGILTKGPGRKLTTQQFKEQFPMSRIRKMTDKESIKTELSELIPEDELDGLVGELQRMASLRTIGIGDYFPLMRYGEYVVYATKDRGTKTFTDRGEAYAYRAKMLRGDPTLDVGITESGNKFNVKTTEKFFGMYESKTEANNARNEFDGAWDISPVQARMSRDTGDVAIQSNAALNTILTTLKGNSAAQAAIKQHYLRSLADQSFRKHELKRKNREGVNYDHQHRNLANYMKQSAYYRAQLEHGWEMGESLQDMDDFSRARRTDEGITTEQLQRVVQQVQYRDKMTNDNVELKTLVREGVNFTQFMMLTSPSYWMINASQPWLVTAPIMGGKHGMGQAVAALKHAQGIVKGPIFGQAGSSWGGLKALLGDRVAVEDAFNVAEQLVEQLRQEGNDSYADLIEELQGKNIIDINVLTELRQIAEGIEGGAWAKTLDASRILAHITEVNNRVVTAIAAYNLAVNSGQTETQAREYAADMVSQTQFNYSSENKPPLFQPGGPLKWAAPLMFQFMQWPQHMYALLIRNVNAATRDESPEVRRQALKSVLGLLGTHAAVGGMVGMALQPIKWAMGLAMMAFGDEDEPHTFANAISGRSFDNLMAEVFTDLFGETGGRAAAYGLPTLLGTDLSARMSMGTLYFVDLRGDTAESAIGSLFASFGGATMNQGVNMARGLGRLADGDILRGIESLSPKILRDATRSLRYYNEGLVNNAGDTVISAKDMPVAELFLQSIGFASDEVAQFYAGQAAIKGAQGYARDRRTDLIRRFVEDGMNTEIMREVTEFNRAYPSLRITRSTLIRGARSQLERETRYRRYGANINEQEATDFAQYGEPYN